MLGSSSFCKPCLCRSGTEVCGNCLVGEFVPVFRSSLRRWSFGQVLVFRSDGQFCLMFGTSGTDREWVDVQPKPFDAYVAYYRTGATTSTKGPPIPHVIHEPGYDDTPIPLESSGIIGQRSLVYGFPIPLTPIQIPPHAKPVAFQSYWSVPYYQRDFVTPNRSNSDHHQAADVSFLENSVLNAFRIALFVLLTMIRCSTKFTGRTSLA